ncbi:MAG: aldehyde dehydrogenase [Bacteroidales bacterium]
MKTLRESLLLQRKFFATLLTRDTRFRKASLISLRDEIRAKEKEICQALEIDLGKSQFEGYATEVGLVLKEISLQIKNLHRWAGPRRVRTPLSHFFSFSYIQPEPYGVVLIIAPWNYPFMLTFTPLAGAVAAGNCVVIKPSQHAPATGKIMEEIIRNVFQEEHVSLFQGGREMNEVLLREPFDYIFFTGSVPVGKLVMEAASKNLTPVSLELGGKSPCIIDADADLVTAARRVVWGKFTNAGQTCVAPDYLFVHRSIKSLFLALLEKTTREFYGPEPMNCPDYPRIINPENVDRLAGLLGKGTVLTGGTFNREKKYFAPTIVDEVVPSDPVMQDEIFGPILPVMVFDELAEAVAFINSRSKPLALYYFGNKIKVARQVLQETSSGGACINDTVMHFANHHLPLGGVGNSGMGRYHGRFTFETFSNPKAVIRKINYPDISLRYPPYKGKLKWIRRFIH